MFGSRTHGPQSLFFGTQAGTHALTYNQKLHTYKQKHQHTACIVHTGYQMLGCTNRHTGSHSQSKFLWFQYITRGSRQGWMQWLHSRKGSTREAGRARYNHFTNC